MRRSAGLESSAKEECWKSRSSVAQVWLRPKVSSLLRVKYYGQPMVAWYCYPCHMGESTVVQSLTLTVLGTVIGWYASYIWYGYWGPGKYMKAETVQYSGTHQRRRTITMYTQSVCTHCILLSTPRFEYISPRGETEHGNMETGTIEKDKTVYESVAFCLNSILPISRE